MAELIRARLGVDPDPSFTDASVAATGGNPLLGIASRRDLAGVLP